MRENRNAPTGAATSAGAKVETGPDFRTGPHLHRQSTTSPPPGQAVHIADFLSTGVAHAITLRNLVALTGWGERDIRRQIEQERRAGALIISDNRNGYFLAADPAEAQRFASSMLNRAGEIRKTARAVEAAAERIVVSGDL